MWPYIVLIIVAVLIIWFIAIYNGLARKKVYIRESWSSIDVQLKRKANVLPNLVDTLKMQTNYEGELLVKLTSARSGIMQGSNADRMKASDEISKLLPSFYAVAENYPQLGANESFRKLMDEIRDCEDKISYARNRYNISVSNYNSAIIVFPSSIVASMFGFKSETFYEINEEQRKSADDMRIKDI